jgi:hypothetical protein
MCSCRQVAEAGRIELPASVLEALKLIIDMLARGQSITLVPHDKELTSQEAADILNVSRPHLIKLLDRGELRFRGGKPPPTQDLRCAHVSGAS